MLDPNYSLDVPQGFDDSDAETGVHPIARKLFPAVTAADAFRKAHEWLREQDVRLADVSWSHMDDEDQPYWLSVYFTFELDPEEP
ncbi:hypothetical protein ACF1HU_07625 [Streptomyces olivaceus]|uniref:hypothetical protein n=1 Tax=Streptomyces olivaceus TaxID=47716 RepID=UPI0004C8EC0C|nr:hypothetical protein [Streptomyces olivaceus]MBZ6104933.1 hypothetical protein [Streptomyces olivaceus]MBZ6285250.1 hypothetical protein [Streptomyces olivaceus]